MISLRIKLLWTDVKMLQLQQNSTENIFFENALNFEEVFWTVGSKINSAYKKDSKCGNKVATIAWTDNIQMSLL